MDALKVDKEFAALAPVLTPEERSLLESSLEIHGCLQPLVVWAKDSKTLLDGHNRYSFCREFGLEFDTIEVELPDRNAARNWIIDNALGRRNLSDEQKSYLRGKRYRAEKKQGKRSDLTSPQNEEKSTTAERLAEQNNVSRATIERDAQYAEAIDTIATNAGQDAKQAILSGAARATKQDIVTLAAMSPAKQRRAFRGGEAKVREVTESTRAKRKECDVPEDVAVDGYYTCPKCGQAWPEGRPI